jgi:NAD(P)-dependent dehydrogenase (short-subunit alcohol dehydrogenase family)
MSGQAGGNIVNVGASRLRGAYLAQRSAYSASKEGLMALTRAAALEFAPSCIRVNAVCPGRVQPDSGEGLEEGMGLGVTAAAVADAVLFLCSNDSKFVTGEVIYVDAGAGMD